MVFNPLVLPKGGETPVGTKRARISEEFGRAKPPLRREETRWRLFYGFVFLCIQCPPKP